MNIQTFKHASKCRLWKGDLLKIAFDGGWYKPEMLDKRIKGLEQCDDLTENEKQLLLALKLDQQTP